VLADSAVREVCAGTCGGLAPSRPFSTTPVRGRRLCLRGHAGRSGYLLKGAELPEIVRAITAIAAGDAIFSSAIARRVIEHFATGSGSSRAAFPSLTEREREVLELIATGKGNAVIAHELMLNLKTVRNHVSNIFGKLQVADRAAAIVKAREAGFGAAPKLS
jgi:DNA-binding NarL/FixJ family response regulator